MAFSWHCLVFMPLEEIHGLRVIECIEVNLQTMSFVKYGKYTHVNIEMKRKEK